MVEQVLLLVKKLGEEQDKQLFYKSPSQLRQEAWQTPVQVVPVRNLPFWQLTHFVGRSTQFLQAEVSQDSQVLVFVLYLPSTQLRQLLASGPEQVKHAELQCLQVLSVGSPYWF